MPCSDDRNDPTSIASKINNLQKLIVILNKFLKINTNYNHIFNIDSLTQYLCISISNLTPEQENDFIYNGRNPESRKLADWWDCHKEWDEYRVKNKLD